MDGAPLHRRPWLAQLGRFALVGGIGFLVDSGCLSAYLAVLPGHLYGGRAVSYLAAATATWTLNARFTFRTAVEHPLRQWFRFILFNLAGGAVNYGVYAALVTTEPGIARHAVVAVAIGSLCGLGANFIVSRRFVFRAG